MSKGKIKQEVDLVSLLTGLSVDNPVKKIQVGSRSGGAPSGSL